MSYYDQVAEAADAIRSRVSEVPQIGVILDSGLGDFANTLTDGISLPYDQLPHWPVSNVIGHEGKLAIGKVRGRTIAALAGRSHLYEGHGTGIVTFATRVLGRREHGLSAGRPDGDRRPHQPDGHEPARRRQR